jgi:hypothetical protein
MTKRPQSAEHIAELSEELAVLADRNGFADLGYILRIAALEARQHVGRLDRPDGSDSLPMPGRDRSLRIRRAH